MPHQQQLMRIKGELYRAGKKLRHDIPPHKARQAWRYLCCDMEADNGLCFLKAFNLEKLRECFEAGFLGKMPYDIKNNWQKKRSLRQQRSMEKIF